MYMYMYMYIVSEGDILLNSRVHGNIVSRERCILKGNWQLVICVWDVDNVRGQWNTHALTIHQALAFRHDLEHGHFVLG